MTSPHLHPETNIPQTMRVLGANDRHELHAVIANHEIVAMAPSVITASRRINVAAASTIPCPAYPS